MNMYDIFDIISYILQHDCLQYKRQFPHIKINCDNLNQNQNQSSGEKIDNQINPTDNPLVNQFMLNAFKNYKENLKDMYNIYMNSPDYKQFINVFNKSASKRRETEKEKDNSRFLQDNNKSNTETKQKNEFSNMFNKDTISNLKNNFVNTLSSDKFANNIKSQ